MSTITSAEKLRPEEARMHSRTTGLRLLPILIVGMFLTVFVVMLFWEWFVVPLGLKPLGYWHAFGLSLFISFIRGKSSNYPQDAQSWKRRCKEGYTTLIFFWISGWLVHLLMEYAGH